MNLEMLATNTTGDVVVGHVVNLSNDLQSIIHGANHVVQTIGHQLDLLVVLVVTTQSISRNVSELGESLLKTRSILEQATFQVIQLLSSYYEI